MCLLDLPPEIFRSIVETYIASIKHDCEATAFQLVSSENSSKAPHYSQNHTDEYPEFFCHELVEALCTIHHSWVFRGAGSTSRYLLRWVFLSNTRDHYLSRTIQYAINQLMEHNVSSSDDQKQQIPLIVSRAVVDSRPSELIEILRGKNDHEVQPPHQDSLFYTQELDKYKFDQSFRHGVGQRSDAAEHILSAAAYLGDISLVDHLLAQDVDVNLRSNVFGQPLRNAALKGHLEIVQLLLNKGADPEGGSHPRTEEDRQAVESKHGKESLEQRFPNLRQLGDTAVEAAAQKSHQKALQLLLQPGFHISQDTYRRAFLFAAGGGHVEIFKSLAASIDWSVFLEISRQSLWNQALRHAAYFGKAEITLLLLENGAEIENEYNDIALCTPLGLAASNGHDKTILLLLEKGADINNGCETPLHTAICTGFVHTVELLLDQGAKVDLGSLRYWKRAAWWGEADIARIFLERGLHEVPGCFDNGEYVLDRAKYAGYEGVLRVYREFGISEDKL